MMSLSSVVVVLLMALMMSISMAADSRRNDQDTMVMAVAKEEMQRANYFAYVMLINMAPPNLFLGKNVTFLMPNDRALAKSKDMMNTSSVADFLLRHSIPSPLLLEHLQRFPTGSILPTSKPQLVLKITNNGTRRSFFLNNVRIISPDICTQGSSIRCHGIDGLIQNQLLITPTPAPPADHDHYCNSSAPTPPPPSSSSGGAAAAPSESVLPSNNNDDTNSSSASPPTATNVNNNHTNKSAAASSGMSCYLVVMSSITLLWMKMKLL